MGWLSAITFAVSMIMQQQAARAARKRQEKMEREAKERADAAKGFQLSAEGESSLLPIQYGRGLLGGVRVYHNTSNVYVKTMPAASGQLFFKSLDASRNGVKHEFLTVQTALSFSELNACYSIIVDGREYTDDKFKSVIGSAEFLDEGRLMGGHRFHVYPSGSVVDPLMVANYNLERPFTNTAYSTAIYALNRDDYQYNGIPDTKFIVEGNKVHTIIGAKGQRKLSAIKTYSNNPALCLLDYLTNSVYGRGVELAYIDLDSFAYAAGICDREVLSNIPLEGTYWNNKGGIRNVKLYECNIALSPASTIRDNTETILETMGQAELVWSGGVYKLSLEYPKIYQAGTYVQQDEVLEYDNDLYRAVNTELLPSTNIPAYLADTNLWSKDVVAAYLTDDDIIRTSENTTAWPNASERLNYCTVRFLNEAKDFVEDSVAWPAKNGTIPGPAIDRGTWIVTKAYARSDIVTHNSVKYQCKGNLPYGGVWNNTAEYSGRERVLFSGNIYFLIAAKEEDYKTNKVDPTHSDYWTMIVNASTVLAPNLDPSWVPYNDANVYNVYREEDHGLPLEADFFESGITDYYHALAKAEQRVRFSRASTVYKFTVITKYTNLEPGDIIQVRSKVLGIEGKLMRIEEVKADSRGNAEITASSYSAATLAWNVADNEVVAPSLPQISFDLEQCTGLAFTTSGLSNTLSSGRLSWTPPADIRVQQFLVKYTLSPIGTITNTTVWEDLGVTRNSYFELPSMSTDSYVLTVVADTGNGKISPKNNGLGSKWPELSIGLTSVVADAATFLPLTIYKRADSVPDTPTGGTFSFETLLLTDTPNGWSLSPPTGSSALYGSRAIAETTSILVPDDTLTWSTPVLYSDVAINVKADKTTLAVGMDFNGNNAIYTEAFGNIELSVGGSNMALSDEASYSILAGAVNCSVTIDTTNGSANKGKYVVTELTGLQGSFKIRVSFRGKTYDFIINVVQLKDVYIKDLTPPPTPSGITVTVGLNTVFIESTPPTYTEGHGHKLINIYGAIGAASVFADAVLIGYTNSPVHTLARSLSEELRLWFKYVSNDDVESAPFGGLHGIDATTLLIGPDDIAADSITANHIAAEAITAAKINANALNAFQITMSTGGHIKGGQTAYNTGNGFFLGYSSTTYKFSLGTSTKGMTWDGSTFAIKNASMNINDLFTVTEGGQLTIKSAASGARVEIYNNVIKVFDATGLRVQIGDLSA